MLNSTGEPIWAETARICSQFFLLVIFALCLVFIIRQAVTSPNVTERIEESAAQVAVPGKETIAAYIPANASTDTLS